jgi:CRISPR-associated protein Csm5
MVWRDQVNVLDQKKIFRLLAKGPRLDSYLAQIRRAEKLDFTSWGGYAQNYALRRIPFDHASASQHYQRARAEDLFIPTFAAAPAGGIYVPASILKGVLRTAMLADRATEGQWKDLAARLEDAERLPRRPAEPVEAAVIGNGGSSRTRPLMLADSKPIPSGGTTRVYLLRTATLVSRGGRLELGWKTSPRGAVEWRRAPDSTPIFAEMAVPGTVFEGTYAEPAGLAHPEVLKAMRWREAFGAARAVEAANSAAARLLEAHRQYAEMTGLGVVRQSVEKLIARLNEIRGQGPNCLICLGWGTGLLSKTAMAGPGAEAYRQILRGMPAFSAAVKSGLPFPKTRQIVFLGDQPATLPGWAELAFSV